ncbi:MAG: radical SAM protein [Bilophila wadsworthia]
MAKDGGAADPLRNPRFQEPSVWQLFRESLFGKPRLLDCIQVEVTSVCPGRCVYCPHTTQAGYWRSRHMEAATFARLWPLMQESGRVHLQGWGEPFLHPRFMDFAALARKAGCRVSTTTCGLRMDETLAGQIVGTASTWAFSSWAPTRPAMPRARACRSAASVRPCARLRVRKAKMGVHLELHFAYLCSPRR